MMMNANATRARGITQRLVLVVALGTTAWGCPHGGTTNPNELLYVHGRIHVDKETAVRWDAGEAAIAAVGEKLQPIPADVKIPAVVPFSGDAREVLGALLPSEGQGATDKRLL
jgi:hypothetical protein